MFKFNMYAAMSHNNPWYGLMNNADHTDEEQDTIKVRRRGHSYLTTVPIYSVCVCVCVCVCVYSTFSSNIHHH